MGVALFIISEILFFLAIFWAYFHSALSPTIELGAHWPPMGIEAINPFELPLMNTVILLSSGFTVTYAHHCLIQGNRKGALNGLVYTIILAILFTALQAVEYNVSFFTISDGTFGSCFYFGTGLMVAPVNCTKKGLDPYWVSGFADAESNFSIKIGKDLTRYKSLRIIPEFSIELHIKDLALLEKIQSFFLVGTIRKRIRGGKPSAIYSVQSIKNLTDIIIPHFNRYVLITQKKEDFNLFCLAVDIMSNKLHLTDKGLKDIITHKASMNRRLPNRLSEMFPEIKPINKNIIKPDALLNSVFSVQQPNTPDSSWLTGFVDGEGCFYIRISKINKKIVDVRFSISQHIRDINILIKIKDYLNCGVMETVNTRPDQANFVVYRFSDIFNKVIPFFHLNPLQGIKQLDYLDFCEICNTLSRVNNKKTKLDDSQLSLIKVIKSKMNKNRYLTFFNPKN